MPAIKYYNRYTQKIETEAVYGERCLRWIYETGLGKLSLHTLIKRKCFSSFYGRRMDKVDSVSKIVPFIEKYNLDTKGFQKQTSEFKTFNDFFTRKLKKEARPINDDENSVVFPADGRHMAFRNIDEVDRIFAKGQSFDLPALLGDADLAKKYKKGSLLISRLCPVDYHRLHFPQAGSPGNAKRINGFLYSVNPYALRHNIKIFWENERVLTELLTSNGKKIILLEVGATCVGKIIQTYTADQAVEKGDEKGYFAFGGSTMITLFEPGAVSFEDDLLEQTAAGHELYARMGDKLGTEL